MSGQLPLDLKYFKELVQERAGLTFDSTREEILRQKVAEVVEQRGYRSRAELYAALRGDEGVFLDFVNHLTINETYFFREPQYLQLLTEYLLPELLAGKPKGEKIKIVSAGCSTGEEPYSIAIALLEKYGGKTGGLFSIIGGDINSVALEKAADGVYGNLSFRNSDEQFRARYFEAGGLGQLMLKPAVRELVRFTRFNLLSAVYPPLVCGADVIFYRNVSIYFDSPTQRKILTSLAATINPGGYVVFSSSETFSHQDIGALSLIESQGLFYYQKARAAAERPGGGVNPALAAARSRARMPEMPRGRWAKQPATPARAISPVKPTKSGNPESRPATGSAAAPAGLFEEALHCYRRKEHARALQLAERLQECERYRVKGFLLSGCILLNREQTQEALALFEKALEIDGLELEAHLLLGLAAKNSGATEKAIRCFHKALYVQSSCWMAHYFLAEIHLSLGNARKAAGYYETLRNILENPAGEKTSLIFFPISFHSADLLHLCRKKISSLAGMSHGV
jgi:chemotaxis protein methyltransferase CheR